MFHSKEESRNLATALFFFDFYKLLYEIRKEADPYDQNRFVDFGLRVKRCYGYCLVGVVTYGNVGTQAWHGYMVGGGFHLR